MIGYLRGKILDKKPPELLLDVNGVGYEVTLPLTCFGELGDKQSLAEIYIHTYVKEDILQLYGFIYTGDRQLFRELIKVNGIGAKMAIAILSSVNASDFQLCVQNNDVDALIKLPGIGKKTAERLLIDMRDRLKNLQGSVLTNSCVVPTNNVHDQAVLALTSLGYKTIEAQKIIQALPDKTLSLEETIKMALQQMR